MSARSTAPSRCCAWSRPPDRSNTSTSATRPSCRSACSTIGTISIGTVERGYAGRVDCGTGGSCPSIATSATIDYARANASIGINGSRPQQRQRQRANPDARYTSARSRRSPTSGGPYGIRVYLCPPASPRRSSSAASRRPTRSTRGPRLVAGQGRRNLSRDPRFRRLPGQGQFRRPARPAGLITAPTPTAPTCSPPRSRRTAAS